eukprot:9474905-Pyramimonas_sp.AAC.1
MGALWVYWGCSMGARRVYWGCGMGARRVYWGCGMGARRVYWGSVVRVRDGCTARRSAGTNLVVAVHSGHHEHLLEELRGLREGEAGPR